MYAIDAGVSKILPFSSKIFMIDTYVHHMCLLIIARSSKGTIRHAANYRLKSVVYDFVARVGENS